jgi:hypothetical protein
LNTFARTSLLFAVGLMLTTASFAQTPFQSVPGPAAPKAQRPHSSTGSRSEDEEAPPAQAAVSAPAAPPVLLRASCWRRQANNFNASLCFNAAGAVLGTTIFADAGNSGAMVSCQHHGTYKIVDDVIMIEIPVKTANCPGISKGFPDSVAKYDCRLAADALSCNFASTSSEGTTTGSNTYH